MNTRTIRFQEWIGDCINNGAAELGLPSKEMAWGLGWKLSQVLVRMSRDNGLSVAERDACEKAGELSWQLCQALLALNLEIDIESTALRGA